MKIAIYSQYLHVFGGGERYILSIAKHLSSEHEVTIFADETLIKKSAEVFGIHLKDITIAPLNHMMSGAFGKYRLLSSFDIVFAMTDGSTFFSPARRNYLIIQSPIHIPTPSMLTTLKMRNWEWICYSGFMQNVILNRTGIHSIQLPPPIDTTHFQTDTLGKKQIILSVGRFFPAPHNKKHDILIETFKKHYLKHFKGYTFIIAGGLSEHGGIEIVNHLKKLAGDAPIEILVDVPFAKLTSLFAQSKIYWHAAGYGEDIETYPERAEHFGITPLEAMSARAVPFAYNAGGPTDVIQDMQNGFLWSNPDELAEKTGVLLRDQKMWKAYSDAAKERALDFSEEKFRDRLMKLIVS